MELSMAARWTPMQLGRRFRSRSRRRQVFQVSQTDDGVADAGRGGRAVLVSKSRRRCAAKSTKRAAICVALMFV